ncbi:MAG: ATP-binding protein [Ardenticatenales bacterium]|nr:ATP-binding protein [Ardenticatenales bacterium]
MTALSIVVLTTVADAFLGAIAGKVTDNTYLKLKGEPSRKAFKQAIGKAIHSYATTGTRLELAQPLLDATGFLTEPSVAQEVTQIINFDREPNIELIGSRWEASINNPPQWRNFTNEADLLLKYLEAELRSTDVFRPVFDSKDINAIANSTNISANQLIAIEQQIESLANLLHSDFNKLLKEFNKVPYDIRSRIYDFTYYIEEKTRGFVGRQWVFNKINHFINGRDNSSGYFFIIGDPGIGKTALAATIVKQKGCLHHFNIRAEGINTESAFLENICAQLIATYQLEYADLHPDTTKNAGFLKKLLGDVSNKLESEENCVIVIDALDEATESRKSIGTNLLFLPTILPKGIFIVTTMRDDSTKPQVACQQDELIIKHDSSDNLSDVEDYIRSASTISGIQTYMSAQNLEVEGFVKLLGHKSDGNFMYLRYVLPEIENGAYMDKSLETLPTGLKDYYEDHWQRMKGRDENAWFQYKLPIIVALTTVPEPVWIELIKDFSKVTSTSRISAVLEEWKEFLHEEQIEYMGDVRPCYRLYHASFYDFMSDKQQVAHERVDLNTMSGFIASTWDEGELF